MSEIERHIIRKRATGLVGQIASEKPRYTEKNPERSLMVRPYPHLNNNPKIKYNDENGMLYVLYYPPIAGKPVNEQVAQREWREFDDVESALRAETKVRGLYDKSEGDVAERTKKVIRLVSLLARRFEGRVTEEELSDMEVFAAKVLVEEKFANAVKEEKQEVVHKVLSAARKDILGRINEPRSEMILGHARVDLVRERIVEEITHEAHKSVVETLLRERAVERFLLSEAADYAEHVSQLKPGIGTPLKKGIEGIEDFFRRYMSHEVIRLKPYSDIAVESRFLVIGRAANKIDQAILKDYLGEEAASILLSHNPRQLRLMTPDMARARLAGIGNRIRSVLDLGDTNLLPEEKRPTPKGPYG